MEKKNLNLLIISIIGLLYAVFISSITLGDNPDPLPLMGLPGNITRFLVAVVWAFFGTMLMVIIIPRILIPIYLKFKGMAMKNYQNMFVKKTHPYLKLNVLLKRTLFISLLSYGLSSMLLSSGVISPDLFVSASSLKEYKSTNYQDIYYYFGVILIATLLLFPIVGGLWATGWALEDAGVMHYSISKEKDEKLFEIEPVHYRYNSLLKGYMGISVIIAFLGNLMYHLTSQEKNFGNMLMAIFLIPMFMAEALLGYVVYFRSSKDFVTKKMKEIRSITEEDLITFMKVKK